MMNEQEKRRPEFQEDSTPIRLADGQEWFFPQPWVQVRPRFENGRIVSSASTTTYGQEFDDMVSAVAEAPDNGEAIVKAMELGAFLLRRNYDLTDEDLGALFVYTVNDPASWETIQEIFEVATGKAPKRTADGVGSQA